MQVESGERSREDDFGFNASRLLHFFCTVLSFAVAPRQTTRPSSDDGTVLSFADWLPKSKVQAYQIDLVSMYLPSNQGSTKMEIGLSERARGRF